MQKRVDFFETCAKASAISARTYNNGFGCCSDKAGRGRNFAAFCDSGCGFKSVLLHDGKCYHCVSLFLCFNFAACSEKAYIKSGFNPSAFCRLRLYYRPSYAALRTSGNELVASLFGLLFRNCSLWAWNCHNCWRRPYAPRAGRSAARHQRTA